MTDRMTEEKAREIISRFNPEKPWGGTGSAMEMSKAEGYLQALEDERIRSAAALENEQAKAKGLVEALEYCAVEPEYLRPESNRQCAVAKNALARYRNSPGKNSLS